MANNATSATIAGAPAAPTRSPTATPQRNAKPSCAPTTSGAVCVDSPAPSGSPETLSPRGSKKGMSLPDLSETLVESASTTPALALDELWSFVLRRANKRWIWIALCRATRQVVAYVVGDRSAATCQKLWEQIPAAYRAAHCYTDF